MVVTELGYVGIPRLVVVENDGFTDGQCLFGNNHLGNSFNLLLLKAKKQIESFNCILREFSSNGKINPQTGRYEDGIYGALQAGEICGSFFPNYYPLQDYNDEFIYSSPVYEDTMTIGSYYNMTSFSAPSSDIIYMFSTIPQGLWIGLSVTFIVLVALLMLANKLLGNRNRPSPLLTVLRAFLNDDNFSGDSLFYLTYATFASTTLFFAVAYLCNSVSTDLVVIDEPVTFTSYDDIVARKAKVGFSEQMPEFSKFKYEPPGNIYHDIWHLSIPFKADPAALGPFIDRVVKQEVVLVGRELLATTLGNIALSALYRNGIDMSHARFLKARDDRARKFTNVYIYNRYTVGKEFPRIVQETVTTLIERGVIQQTFDKFPEVIQNMIGDTKASISRMVSWHIERSETDFVPVGFQNIKILLACFFGCICFSIFILLGEKHFKHFQASVQPRVRKQPRVSINVIKHVPQNQITTRIRRRQHLDEHFEEVVHVKKS